jgi:hypothetical protein
MSVHELRKKAGSYLALSMVVGAVAFVKKPLITIRYIYDVLTTAW